MRKIAPLMLAMVPYGMAFGVAALQNGLDPLSILLLSGLVFAGSSQFAALDLWTEPLALLPIWLTTLAINARHLLYGAALYPWLRSITKAHRSTSVPWSAKRSTNRTSDLPPGLSYKGDSGNT